MVMMQRTPPMAEEAADCLRKAVSLEADDAQAWALLGSALLDVPGREAESRAALGRASELIPTDAVLAGRHIRACCASSDLEHGRATLQRMHAMGLSVPKSALHRVYQALGGEGDGARASAARLLGSGSTSNDARALAAVAALAAERRVREKKDGVDTMGMAVFFHQLAEDVEAEARCRQERLACVRDGRKWERDSAALGALVEEAAQLLQVYERMGAPRAPLRAMHQMLHDAEDRTSDELSATAGFEELTMLLRAVERHVGTASDDDDSDEE
jgi:cytochrome c-type biogenesis protein CcmH/NrfG